MFAMTDWPRCCFPAEEASVPLTWMFDGAYLQKSFLHSCFSRRRFDSFYHRWWLLCIKHPVWWVPATLRKLLQVSVSAPFRTTINCRSIPHAWTCLDVETSDLSCHPIMYCIVQNTKVSKLSEFSVYLVCWLRIEKLFASCVCLDLFLVIFRACGLDSWQ